MIYLSDYLKASDVELSPEEYELFRDKFSAYAMLHPAIAPLRKTNPAAYQRVRELVTDAGRPLATEPKKGWFHPAVKTPLYLAHKFLSAAEPTGLYRSAAEGGRGMTPQQEAVEEAMWSRMAPQNPIAKTLTDVGTTLAGTLVPMAGVAKLSKLAQARIFPQAFKTAQIGGRAALSARAAAQLIGTEVGVFGGGWGAMDAIRAMVQGKPLEEAAQIGLKSGAVAGAMTGVVMGLGQLKLSLQKDAGALRMAAKLGATKSVQETDDILRIALERVDDATDPKARDAWRSVAEMARLSEERFRGELGPGGPVPFYTLVEQQGPRAAKQMERLRRAVPSVAKMGPVTLQPWELTQQEFVTQARAFSPGVRGAVTAKNHQLLVQQALKGGKPVPKHVLASYPGLRRVAPEAFDALVARPSQAGTVAAKIQTSPTRGAWGQQYQTYMGAEADVFMSKVRNTVRKEMGGDHFKTVLRYVVGGGEKGAMKHRVARMIGDGHSAQQKGLVIGDAAADRTYQLLGKQRTTPIGKFRPTVAKFDDDIRNAIEQTGLAMSDDLATRTAAQAKVPGLLQKLTPQQREIVRLHRVTYDRWWRIAKAEGLDIGFVEGYFPRLAKRPPGITGVEWSKMVGPDSPMMKSWLSKFESVTTQTGKPSMLKERVLGSFDEFAEHIRAYGLEPITDPAEVLRAYSESMGKYIGWSKVARDISQLVDPKGNPLVTMARAPEWKELMHPAFRDFLHKVNPQFKFGRRVWAEPKLADMVNRHFAPPSVKEGWVANLSAIFNYYKQILFYNPAIHGKNLLSDFSDEFNFNIVRMAKAHMGAGKTIQNLDDALWDSMDSGLELAGSWTMSDWHGAADLSTLPVVGRLFKSVNTAMRANQWVLFDYGMKRAQLATWQMKWQHLAKKYPGQPVDSVKRAAAHFVNDLYGTLPKHWFNATAYKTGTWALLARNWTTSNLDLVSKAMFKRGLGSATLTAKEMSMIQREYINHIGKGVFGILVEAELLTWGATAVFSGEPKHMWNYPMPQWLSVHTNTIDTKGREIQFPIPLFAYIRDILQWPAEPGQVFWNKLHPIWKLAMDELTNYSHWQHRNIVPPGANRLEAAGHRLAYAGQGIMPLARPVVHIATGSPQPGVTEPRYIPALAYLTGGYVKHGKAGHASDAKLFDKMDKFFAREGYKREQDNVQLMEHLSKGESDLYHEKAAEMGYSNPRYIVQKEFNYRFPELAMWQNQSKRNKRLWKEQASAEDKAKLETVLREQHKDARLFYLDEYRRRMGEWSPVKENQ